MYWQKIRSGFVKVTYACLASWLIFAVIFYAWTTLGLGDEGDDSYLQAFILIPATFAVMAFTQSQIKINRTYLFDQAKLIEIAQNFVFSAALFTIAFFTSKVEVSDMVTSMVITFFTILTSVLGAFFFVIGVVIYMRDGSKKEVEKTKKNRKSKRI
jgi:hypothetical protein